MIKQIQHRSRYNNYISALIDVLENYSSGPPLYARMLAEKTDFKNWVAEQKTINPSVPRPFITEEMLNKAEDPQVIALHQLSKKLNECLEHFGSYWRGTDEINMEMN